MYETSAKKKVHSQTMEHKIERQSRFGFQLRNPPIFFLSPPSLGACRVEPLLCGGQTIVSTSADHIDNYNRTGSFFSSYVICLPVVSRGVSVCPRMFQADVPAGPEMKIQKHFRGLIKWNLSTALSPGSAGGRLTPTVSWKSFQSAGIPKRPVGPILIFFGRFFGNNNFPGEYA